jgi:hypothetical protein
MPPGLPGGTSRSAATHKSNIFADATGLPVEAHVICCFVCRPKAANVRLHRTRRWHLWRFRSFFGSSQREVTPGQAGGIFLFFHSFYPQIVLWFDRFSSQPLPSVGFPRFLVLLISGHRALSSANIFFHKNFIKKQAACVPNPGRLWNQL